MSGDGQLAGRAVLITGANRGIGLAVARRMGAGGARIAVNGRDRERTQLAVADLRDEGMDAVAVVGDVGAPGGGQAVVDATVRALGGLHVLVNNAGIDADTDTLELALEDWDRVLATNLTGTMACSRAAAAHMARGGVIVNLGSLWGNLGMPERAAYAASKHGVRALTAVLARAWRERGIGVVCVDPGYIETAMIESVRGGTRADLLRRTPIGRLGAAADVAGAVAFLAGDAARALDGGCLAVDGGWMAYGGW